VPGDIAVEDGRISEIGSVARRPSDRELHCDGDIVTAGLVNTHHHLYQWMTRGRATSCDLFGWLQELYPVWNELSVDDVAAAATVGLAELARSGATTVADHHYVVPRGDDTVFDAIAAAARSVGIRLHLSRGSMDLGESAGGLPPDDIVEDVEAILASRRAAPSRRASG
jgi:cytosine/adenosine deaminase-related metal-dependent hydrolase